MGPTEKTSREVFHLRQSRKQAIFQNLSRGTRGTLGISDATK